MQWTDIQFNPSHRILRPFAGLWLAVFGGMAAWQGLVRGHPWLGAGLAVAALTVGPLGLVAPGAIRPIYVGWMVLAFPIGWTVSRVLLAIVYYGVFTPVGLIFRLIGRDPLSRRFEPDRPSYWTPKAATTDLRRYFRQS